MTALLAAAGRLADGPRRQFLLVAAGFVALTAFMARHNLPALDRAISNYPDAYFGVWRLAWIAHQLPRDPWRIFDANIFYPLKNTAAYSDIMLLPGLMAAPALWAGLPPVLTFNLALLGGFASSGLAAYLLVRTVSGSVPGGILAGTAFAFAPIRFDHYTQLETQMTAWMPLSLWALHQATVRGSAGYAVLVGVFVGCQMLSALYYGLFLAPFIVVIAAICIWHTPRDRMWRVLGGLALGGLIGAILVLPYVPAYLDLRREVGGRNAGEIAEYSAGAITDYLATPAFNVWYGWTADKIGGNERHLFPGLIVTLFAIVGLWPPLSRVRVAYLVGLLFAYDASRGPHGFVYPVLSTLLPAYQGLRAPSRFALLVVLALGVHAGFGMKRLWKANLPGRLAAVAAIAIAILEYRSVPPLRWVPEKTPTVYAWLAKQPPAVIVEMPVSRGDRLDRPPDPDYMYYSIFHWHKLLNGYSGYYPATYWELMEKMLHFPSWHSIEYLKERGTDYMLLHPDRFDPNQLEEILSALRQREQLEFVGVFPSPGNGTFVYRFRRDGPRHPG